MSLRSKGDYWFKILWMFLFYHHLYQLWSAFARDAGSSDPTVLQQHLDAKLGWFEKGLSAEDPKQFALYLEQIHAGDPP